MKIYLMLNGNLRIEDNSKVANNLRRKGWQDAPSKPSDEATWKDGAWVILSAQNYTAEQWLEQNGFGGSRQPALIYLRQAGAVSIKLDAIEAYMKSILAQFAQDSSPRSAWAFPPFTFEETVAEAVKSFTAPPVPEGM